MLLGGDGQWRQLGETVVGRWRGDMWVNLSLPRAWVASLQHLFQMWFLFSIYSPCISVSEVDVKGR